MDYKRRTQQIIQQLDANHLDWFIVNELKNVRYLSGFTGSHGVLLISAEKQYIVTDGRYTEQVQQEVKTTSRSSGKRKELEAVRDALGSVSSKRVAFEAEHISYSNTGNDGTDSGVGMGSHQKWSGGTAGVQGRMKSRLSGGH